LSEATAVSKVEYKPAAKMGSAIALRNLLEGPMKQRIADVLPRYLTPERFLRVLLAAVNKTPKLLDCSQESIVEGVINAAQTGLEIGGVGGEAYLVPYGSHATFIPGYRGLAKLARNSGEIKRLEAEVVCEGDHFVYQKGTDFKLEYRPCLTGARGKPLGAYALCEFKDGGIQAHFMSAQDIEAVRNRSRAAKDGPWVTDWAEMARKTVFRNLSKWLPLTGENWQRALELDNEDFSETIDILPPKAVTAQIVEEAESSGSIGPEPVAELWNTWLKAGKTEGGWNELMRREFETLSPEDLPKRRLAAVRVAVENALKEG
jgi:phage RecT family recombinase